MNNQIKKAKTACQIAAYKASRKYNVEIVISYDEGIASYSYMPNKNKYHIHIGLGLPRELEEKLPLETSILGIFYHELGHVIHTDFEGLPNFEKIQNEDYEKVPVLASDLVPAIRDGRVLDINQLNNDEKKVYEEIVDTVKDYIFQSKRMSVLNSFEDGAIENYVSMMHPESYIYISKLRNEIVAREMEANKSKYNSALQEKEVTDYILDSLITEIRAYSTLYYRRKNIRFSFLSKKGVDEYLGKYGFTQKTIKELKTLGLYSRFNAEDTVHRLACSDMALNYLMPLIEEKARDFVNTYFVQLSMDNTFTGEDFANMLGADCANEFAVERRINCPSSASSSEPKYKMRAPKELDEEVQKKVDEYEKEKEETNNQSGEGNQSNDTEMSENDSGETSSEGETSEDSNNSNEKQNDSDSADGTKNSNDTAEQNENKGDGSNDNAEMENTSAKTRELSEEEIIQEENNKEANEEKKYEKKLEKIMNKKMKEANEASIDNVAKSIASGNKPSIDGAGEINSHDGVECNFYKHSFSDEIDSYNLRNLPLLKSYASKIAEPLKKTLVYDAKSTIDKGLKTGKVSLSNLYRSTTDLRCFQNKTEGKVKKAYISVLIDQSGSMSGENIVLAREAAYLLAEACRRVGIKISVNGHSTGYGNVEYYQYCDFSNCNKPMQIKQILSAEAGGANRDGYAIYLSDAYLYKNAPEDALKVSIVISDGAPSDTGYHGQSAVDDIRSINKMFERKGIQTIGIGIGYDVDSVEKIYDNHVIVHDVGTLGGELIKILKNIIK